MHHMTSLSICDVMKVKRIIIQSGSPLFCPLEWGQCYAVWVLGCWSPSAGRERQQQPQRQTAQSMSSRPFPVCAPCCLPRLTSDLFVAGDKSSVIGWLCVYCSCVATAILKKKKKSNSWKWDPCQEVIGAAAVHVKWRCSSHTKTQTQGIIMWLVLSARPAVGCWQVRWVGFSIGMENISLCAEEEHHLLVQHY